ncbi:MAG TPA: hypothetical protein VFL94_05370 [Actinomycetales bacterium]|nr:hypothetical protein [Actinomycetales bacterium]
MTATASTQGFEVLSTHDLGGFGDGMQVLRHGDLAYVGHHGVSRMGTSILDVSDVRSPKLIRQIPAPERTHTHKVQIADGLLLVNHEAFPPGVDPDGPVSSGLAVYSLDDPSDPVQIGFWDVGGRGVHRIVYTGGRYAYLSATPEGFNDRMWMVVDLADPTSPREVGRWWWPGQHVAAGEDETWPAGSRYAAHHALVRGDLAFLGYDDANLVVLDISRPEEPQKIGGLIWGGGSTHTCLPLGDREVVAVTDEQVKDGPEAPERTIRLVDVSDPRSPAILSKVQPPDPSWAVPGARFGAHNLHENRPGSYVSDSLIFATYFSAGLRVYDVEDATNPREVAHWVGTPAPGKPAVAANDLYVGSDGLVFVTDRVGAGLAILAPTPELRALMERRAA